MFGYLSSLTTTHHLHLSDGYSYAPRSVHPHLPLCIDVANNPSIFFPSQAQLYPSLLTLERKGQLGPSSLDGSSSVADTMQCVRSVSQLVRAPRPASSLLTASSRTVSSQTPAPDRRILVKPLPPSSLDKTAESFFVPNRQDPSFHCEDFTMVLKGFPRHLTDQLGRLDETRLMPSWLPLPIDPATHQRRHLRSPLYQPSAPSKEGDADRWEPIPNPTPLSAEGRPILRIFVMSSKKRIHKLAVIRHRTRTRLVSALRTAIFRLQDSDIDAAQTLDLRKQVIMLIASPTAYSRKMEVLVSGMEKALRRVTSTPTHKFTPIEMKSSDQRYDK
ncbi:hypothetical protein NDA11_007403 [Ustilago hordei]|nr:hypothetical protein NDA11_007403 [Ustilago hordei]